MHLGSLFKIHKHCHANTIDRKSTRLNSSHSQISYAVFCLKKKTAPRGRLCVCRRRSRDRLAGRAARGRGHAGSWGLDRGFTGRAGPGADRAGLLRPRIPDTPTTVPVDSAWTKPAVPLADVTSGRGVRLPEVFPGEWKYWVRPATVRGGSGDRPRLDLVFFFFIYPAPPDFYSFSLPPALHS